MIFVRVWLNINENVILSVVLCGKGVMGEASTAMRDVMFYPYHEFIDNIFNRYKNSLLPYQLTEVCCNFNYFKQNMKFKNKCFVHHDAI